MTYLRLFWEFFKTGLFAVGGGMATVPFLKNIGLATGWYSQTDLMNMLAVSESTPGPIGINMATYVGFTVAGIPGAVIATIGEVTPSIIVILIVAAMLTKFRNSKYVENAFYGLRPASSGLIGAACAGVVLQGLLRVTSTAAPDSLLVRFSWDGTVSWMGLALAAVLMVWSVLGGTGSASSSSMEYSTVVHYFESLQVTQFSLDLNTGVITMNLKEGGKNNLPLPDTTSQSTTQATGGLLSGMLSSSDEDTAAQKNSDGTVTVRYKLPYASMFVKYVGDYIAAYDAANPDAPMVYDYTPVKENIPWMEILFYLAMLGCTGFLLFSMMRGGAGGGGIKNVG